MKPRDIRDIPKMGLQMGEKGIEFGGRAIGFAVGTVGRGVELLGSTLRLAGLGMKSGTSSYAPVPGDVPGIEGMKDIDVPPDPGHVEIDVIDYSETRMEVSGVEDLKAFLAGERPEWVVVRWINVSGTHPYVVNEFREFYGFHTLAAEDVLHVPQRPRVEFYEDNVFVVLRMLQLVNTDGDAGVALDTEQVGMFLFDNTLITFQEKPGDVSETRSRSSAYRECTYSAQWRRALALRP
ncbi:MAG: CorA family divalent cation transporter [Gammaproteobacteria bacterium]|nr:CorA family divalent cation transporter [Gammaproteobacteria bacterium]